jgi:hypothetical protein
MNMMKLLFGVEFIQVFAPEEETPLWYIFVIDVEDKQFLAMMKSNVYNVGTTNKLRYLSQIKKN